MRIRRQPGDSSPAVPSWLARRGEHLPAPRAAGTDSERIAALASSAGAPVHEVLREVADFRLALETDMIIAAAAVDAGELGLASDLVAEERAGLAEFQERMLERLVDAARSEHDDLAARRVRTARRTGRARLATAAAALIAIVGGGTALAPGSNDAKPSTQQVALELADEQLSTLTGTIVRDASSADISVAADELHETLETLIAEHAEGNPVMAMRIADLIREEQRLLGVDRSPATVSVLNDVARLVRQLRLRRPRRWSRRCRRSPRPRARPRAPPPPPPSPRRSRPPSRPPSRASRRRPSRRRRPARTPAEARSRPALPRRRSPVGGSPPTRPARS